MVSLPPFPVPLGAADHVSLHLAQPTEVHSVRANAARVRTQCSAQQTSTAQEMPGCRAADHIQHTHPDPTAVLCIGSLHALPPAMPHTSPVCPCSGVRV